MASSSRVSSGISNTAITPKRNTNYEDTQRMSHAARILENKDLLVLHAANRHESIAQARSHFLNLIHFPPSSAGGIAPHSIGGGASVGAASARRNGQTRNIEFPVVNASTTGSPVTGTRVGPRMAIIAKQQQQQQQRMEASTASDSKRHGKQQQQQQQDQQQQHSQKKKRSLPDEMERRAGPSSSQLRSSAGSGREAPSDRRPSSNIRRKRRSALSDSN